MFNLLVSYAGWSTGGELTRERVFEYTSDDLIARFKPNGRLDVEQLRRLPTLFMSEIGGSGSQSARLGQITDVRGHGSKYHIECAFDGSIPAIPNSVISEHARSLDIDEWELSRTHWAVKDADIFQMLFRMTQPTIAPTVFDISTEPVDESLVAIMMPFDAAFNSVYETLVKATRGVGKQAKRADDIWRHDAVIQDIVGLICEAGVVICDLTGRNPNVFYEAGIAHTLGKNVILIAQSAEDVPFNLRHLRFIKYLNNSEGREKLSSDVQDRLQTIERTTRRTR